MRVFPPSRPSISPGEKCARSSSTCSRSVLSSGGGPEAAGSGEGGGAEGLDVTSDEGGAPPSGADVVPTDGDAIGLAAYGEAKAGVGAIVGAGSPAGREHAPSANTAATTDRRRFLDV